MAVGGGNLKEKKAQDCGDVWRGEKIFGSERRMWKREEMLKELTEFFIWAKKVIGYFLSFKNFFLPSLALNQILVPYLAFH